MKTLKLKALLVTIMVIVFAVLTNIATAGGGPTTSPNGRFESENMDIRNDLSAISLEKNNIKFLEARYKKDREAGNKAAMLADKKELAKARANLKQKKAYLAADKRDLVRSHKLVLSEQRKEIRKYRDALNASKRKHSKDLASGNAEAAQQSALLVVQRQNELKHDQAALRRARIDMNENLLAVNKEIKKSDGQFVGLIVAENVVAHVDNWITDKTK